MTKYTHTNMEMPYFVTWMRGKQDYHMGLEVGALTKENVGDGWKVRVRSIG